MQFALVELTCLTTEQFDLVTCLGTGFFSLFATWTLWSIP